MDSSHPEMGQGVLIKFMRVCFEPIISCVIPCYFKSSPKSLIVLLNTVYSFLLLITGGIEIQIFAFNLFSLILHLVVCTLFAYCVIITSNLF